MYRKYTSHACRDFSSISFKCVCVCKYMLELAIQILLCWEMNCLVLYSKPDCQIRLSLAYSTVPIDISISRKTENHHQHTPMPSLGYLRKHNSSFRSLQYFIYPNFIWNLQSQNKLKYQKSIGVIPIFTEINWWAWVLVRTTNLCDRLMKYASKTLHTNAKHSAVKKFTHHPISCCIYGLCFLFNRRQSEKCIVTASIKISIEYLIYKTWVIVLEIGVWSKAIPAFSPN